jgi:hypothetical protein
MSNSFNAPVGTPGVGGMPIAGYNTGFVDKWREISPTLEGMSPIMQYGIMSDMMAQDREARDAANLPTTLRMIRESQLESAKEAQQLGMMSNAFASLIKDVPAAFVAASQAGVDARNRQIQGSQEQARGSNILPARKSYYGFVG